MKYDVTVTREPDLWVAVVDGLPPHLTSAADYDSFTTLHEDLPLVIADLTDTNPDTFTLTYRYEINGHDVTADMERLKRALPNAPNYAKSMRENPERTRKLDEETYVKNIEIFGRVHG